MEINLLDILVVLVFAWAVRNFILSLRPTEESDEPALAYVRERVDGMEFELEQINGIWYCWILENKVYTFIGQSPIKSEVEDACKKHVHDLCVKGLTT